jgi:hypothetical protein
MGSGSDESIYWILTMVITFSYHNYKIAIHSEHYRLPLTATSQLTNHSESESELYYDWRSVGQSVLVSSPHNWRIYHESPLCRLDTDCIENTSSDVLVEAMLSFSCPAKSYSGVFTIVAPHSLLTRMFTESLLSKNDIPPLLRVWTCLPSYCLATVWSNPLQYVYITFYDDNYASH